MPRPLLRVLFASLVLAPAAVESQSASDFAAWTALVRNPHGAFAPDLPLARTDGIGTSPTVRARYATWEFGPGDDETTNLGLGVDFQAGARTVRVDALLSSVKGCDDCGAVGLNLGLIFPLSQSGPEPTTGFEVSVIPGVGFTSWGGGDLSSIAGSVEVPIALRVDAGGLRLRPFFSPGYGFARVSNGSQSETGSLPSYGYGLAIGGARWDVSLGARQIALEDAPDVMGVNLAWRW